MVIAVSSKVGSCAILLFFQVELCFLFLIIFSYFLNFILGLFSFSFFAVRVSLDISVFSYSYFYAIHMRDCCL
jgi:hypothetical protein